MPLSILHVIFLLDKMESCCRLSLSTEGLENMKDLSAQSNPLNQQFKHERIPGRVLESGPESSDRENIPKINIYKEIKHSDQMHPE